VLAGDKIRINAVAPAVVETPLYSTFMTKEQVQKTLPTFNAFHPLRRNGQPGDVAEAILPTQMAFSLHLLLQRQMAWEWV